MEYYARSPLEVFAVDENMERLTGSIPYTSLIWHRRYNKPGEFSMQVLSDVYDPSWAFIVCSDRPETGIVQKVEYSDTALTPDGRDTITVSGFFLETLLYDVTFLVEETGEKVIEIKAPRNSNRGYTRNQEPVEVYWSTVANKYVYRDKESGQIKDNDGNTVAFGGLEKVDYEWNGKVHEDSIEMPDGSKVDGYWQDRNGYYTSDDGETISRVSYASSSGGPDSDKTFDVELKVGGKYFYKWNDSTLVMVNGVSESREDTYWVSYRKWKRGPKTKTIQVKGPWQRTEVGQPEEEGDSIELVIKWVRKFFTNEWQFAEPEFEGETMVLDLSLKYLGDVVYDTLARIEAAPRVQYDFESDTTVFSVYRGEDLTQEAMQEAAQAAHEDPEDPDEPVEPDEAFPYAVFNDTWGSMYGYSASADDSNYKNTCYVLYDYDAPNAFTTNGYPKPEGITELNSEGYPVTTGWRIPYTTEQGYFEVTVGDEGERRQETYLDMREQDPSCSGDWPRDDQQFDEPKTGGWFSIAKESEIEAFLEEQGIPKCKDIYDGFQQSLKDAGTTHLKTEYSRVYNLDTGTLNTDGYIRDYDLGDKVDWGVYSLGIQRTGRISEVEEVYESGNIQINLTVGDELVSLMDKARRS